jgi:hypothetical protein
MAGQREARETLDNFKKHSSIYVRGVALQGGAWQSQALQVKARATRRIVWQKANEL